jgi:hypothetical protein
MDQLPEEQRKAITKLTAVRLAAKLTQIGVSESELEVMNKEAMMHAWASAVLEERDKPVVAEVAEAKPEVKVGYDVALERRRLDFEMRKWEAERAEKLRECAWSRRKLRKEPRGRQSED